MLKGIDKNYWIIGIASALFFLPFLGGVHLFDWDEINFAECAREMVVTGEYLRPTINFEPFWEKPPLFFWLQSLAMHIFGVNEYAARFPNAICGISTLLITYHIGKKLYDKKFGWFWTLSYFGSILPHLYFKSAIIDPVFNLFIFLSLYFLIKTENPNDFSERAKSDKSYPLSIFVAGTLSGLAILTKGPVGFLIVALTWLIKLLIFRELTWSKIKHFALFSVTALFVTSLWFGVETLKNGTWFLNTFIDYNLRLAKTQDAGHGGFWGYHFVVILFGCFPASIFALRSLYKGYNFYNEKVDFTRWMKVLFWVVIVLFSLVQSKIVHYSSMCYLPLTFLSAITLKTILENKVYFSYVKILLLIVGILLGSIVVAVPFVGQHIEMLKPLFKNDIFALKNLEANVKWTGAEAIAGFILILTIVIYYFLSFKQRVLRGLFVLAVGVAVFVNLALVLFVGKIEGYSQNAAIEFYKLHATEDAYVEAFGFKSYAHLFYAKKRVPTNSNHLKMDFLLRGPVDKPTYFAAHIPEKNQLDTTSTLQFLYEKNGFVFYRRK